VRSNAIESKRRDELGPLGGGRNVEKSDHRHRWLLRPHRERPSGRAAEKPSLFAADKRQRGIL
jgi:hypothetical protein